jgi:predicted aspartyl protease
MWIDQRQSGTLLVETLVLFMVTPALSQKLTVKIINRQDKETGYTYVVPERSTSTSNTSVNCSESGDYLNCNARTRTNGSSTPALEVSYHVRGATLSLQLPDSRVAVANCDSKFAEHFAGTAGNHRSCRVPLVNDIEAEFNGNKAKLRWSVSIDGKKIQSETYKILAILDRPKQVGSDVPLIVSPQVTASRKVKTGQPLDNSAIVEMVGRGLSEASIVAAINELPGNYALYPDAVLILKTSGVPQAAVAAMSLNSDNSVLSPAHNGPRTARLEVSLKRQNGVLLVPVLINDKIPLDFVLDSGAADVSIPADVVLTLMRTGTLGRADFTGTNTYVFADGSEVPSQTFRIRSLRVGDLVLESVSGSVASVNGSLLLGQSFLSRFKSWSIDNTRQVLLLQ